MPRNQKNAEDNGKLAKNNPVDISEVLDADPDPETEAVVTETMPAELTLPDEAQTIIQQASAALGLKPDAIASMVMKDALLGQGHRIQLLKSIANEQQEKEKREQLNRIEREKNRKLLELKQLEVETQARALGMF